MKEINVKTNNTGLKIEIDGQPNYDNMSEVDKSVFAGKFEKVVFEILDNTYQKNDRKGTAKIKIRGKGEFGGEKIVSFNGEEHLESITTTNNTYEIYDPVNNPAHIGQTRYTVKDVKFEAADFDSFVESYIENIVFDDIAKTAAGSDDDKTDVKLVGDYVRYRLAGDEKPNNAMVTTFTPPNQVYPKKETSGDVSLKIQCSSNTDPRFTR